MFKQQLYALLWRNILIKKKRKRQTIFEVIFPLYMIALVVIMKNTTKGDEYPEVAITKGNASMWRGDMRSVFQVVGLAPNTTSVNAIKGKLEDILKRHQHSVDFVVYESSEAMLVDYQRQSRSLSAGVVFMDDPKETNTFHYDLRFPYNSVPEATTSKLYASPGDCRSLISILCPSWMYMTSGFSVLQAAIDSAILQVMNETVSDVPDSLISIYPKAAYKETVQTMSILIPLYLVISFSPLMASFIVAIVYEKEKKIKEAMLIMGLRPLSFWLSWFLVESLLIIPLSLIASAIFTLAGVLPNTNFFVIFFLILLYGISLVVLAFMLTPFFDKSKTAGTVCGLIVSIFGVVHLLAVYVKQYLSTVVFHLLALLSPAAFGIGLVSVVEMDTAGHENNLFEGKFSPGSAIIMLLIDIALYGLLAVYFDLVIPGEFGPRFPPWFFLLPSYWRKDGSHSKTNEEPNEMPSMTDDDVEPVPLHMRSKEAVRIVNVKKTFSKCRGQQVKAVDGINLQIYEDQITAILGHNGAGKTTLINILVGMTPPTSGSARIFGLDVSDPGDLATLRGMTGICLQENILIEELTTEEHLTFFARLKGISKNVIHSEVEGLISELNLRDCKDTIAKSLSGGQKRKLCVAIALIGDPKVIFLDEPSSGVDPFSRRQMWSLLQKKKEGHVIVLTTHFMDEADILADRKAIVSRGKTRCVGSSFFLKNKFGIGYHLIVDADAADTNEKDVTRLVKSYIQEASLSRITVSELSYLLPLERTKTFPALFSAIEEACNSKTHGLKSYGIAMPTLEEVFITLGEESNYQEGDGDTQNNEVEQLIQNINELEIPECHHSSRQAFLAFLKARLLLLWRNPRSIVMIVLTPVILILINYFLLKNSAQSSSSGSLQLSTKLYPNSPLKLQNNTGKPLSDFESFFGQRGVDIDFVHNMTLSALMPSFMALIKENSEQVSLIVNDTAVHYLPIIQNLWANFHTWSNKINKSLEISTNPFPKSQKESDGVIQFDGLLYTWAILLSTTLAYMAPTVALEVVEDRELRIKNQLRISGLSFGLYWLITALVHFAVMLIPIMSIVVGIAAMDIFHSTMANAATAILFLLYIPSALLYSYVITFIFDRQDTAKRLMTSITFFVSFIPTIAIFMVMTFASYISTAMHVIFCIFSPLYCPAGGMLFIAQINQELKVKKSLGLPASDSAYFEVSRNVVITFIIMVANVFIYLLVLRVVDVAKSGGRIGDAFQLTPKGQGYVTNPKSSVPDEDEDVAKERRKVETLDSCTQAPVLLIKEMGKQYFPSRCGVKQKTGGKVAVHNLSMALQSGHIFGLLGPNGAGKTSTMKMVIAEESPTYGQINVAGYNVTSSLSAAFRMMGYCPQHDALWEKLTLSEHIRLYAGIRGIAPSDIEKVCSKMVSGLNVDEHADKQTRTLSGGTKRKLSYILAMIGNPRLVLLDEPSTGMDPQSKRFLWNTICAACPAQGNRTVLLTTHSMEEADVLCTRIGIMVNGRLKCLGSSQHLKNKYGGGYSLDIKLRDVNKFEELVSFATRNFETCKQKEFFGNRMTFYIPKSGVRSIAEAFAKLEEVASDLSIEEYSFSQTTLEQVFIDFAKQQEEI